jgi:hypothetical protein
VCRVHLFIFPNFLRLIVCIFLFHVNFRLCVSLSLPSLFSFWAHKLVTNKYLILWMALSHLWFVSISAYEANKQNINTSQQHVIALLDTNFLPFSAFWWTDQIVEDFLMPIVTVSWLPFKGRFIKKNLLLLLFYQTQKKLLSNTSTVTEMLHNLQSL